MLHSQHVGWVLQVRGDFPGICFELLAIRLLLSPSRWAMPMAGRAPDLRCSSRLLSRLRSPPGHRGSSWSAGGRISVASWFPPSYLRSAPI